VFLRWIVGSSVQTVLTLNVEHVFVSRHGVYVANWTVIITLLLNRARHFSLRHSHYVLSVCHVFAGRCLITGLNNVLSFRAHVFTG
jgi:hypothetical protein